MVTHRWRFAAIALLAVVGLGLVSAQAEAHFRTMPYKPIYGYTPKGVYPSYPAAPGLPLTYGLGYSTAFSTVTYYPFGYTPYPLSTGVSLYSPYPYGAYYPSSYSPYAVYGYSYLYR